MRGHSSALESAEMARSAAVGSLVLTHYGEHATAQDLDEAAKSLYTGKIAVADDHAVLTVKQMTTASR